MTCALSFLQQSHYRSLGPEFYKVLFDFGGQSPLILYYLKMHELGGISVTYNPKGSKFTKILREPYPSYALLPGGQFEDTENGFLSAIISKCVLTDSSCSVPLCPVYLCGAISWAVLSFSLTAVISHMREAQALQHGYAASPPENLSCHFVILC